VNKLSLVLLISLSLVGCKKAADLSKYKDRATALAAKYAPKLGELSKKLPELASHAKDLPVNVPGADKLGKLLEDNKSELASAQDLLAGLPAKIATESPEQAQKDLDAADKSLSTEVAAAEDDEKQEAAIEAAPPPAAPPTGSAGSGSAGSAGSAGIAAKKK
jgi:hypothetical protein